MTTRHAAKPSKKRQRPKQKTEPLAEALQITDKNAAVISLIVSKPKRLLVIGALKYGPESKRGADIVRFLCAEGTFDVVDVSNVYKTLRQFVKAGIVSKDEQGQHMLTEIGNQIDLNEKQFRDLVGATKKIRTIVETVQFNSE